MTAAPPFEQRIIVLAPRGRDADVIASMLASERIDAVGVSDAASLLERLREGAAAAILTQEGLDAALLDTLAGWLATQETWSDFPFVVLAGGGAAFSITLRTEAALQKLGNVIVLDRPLKRETLRSAASSALRARRRQYAMRQALTDRNEALDQLLSSEQALLALNDTLESRIADRTHALALANDRIMNEAIARERVQQSLVQFQKMEAVGRLTGGIAHDFNNILNVIQNGMDLILLLSAEAQTKARAEAARRACVRGSKLTAQLLAFSRDQKLDLRPVQAGTALDNMRELITASVGSRIVVTYDVAPDMPPVLADPIQLEMAVLNLAINARDAMDGAGAIALSVRRSASPPFSLQAGEYGVVSVADTGPGITAGDVTKVFEPFFTTKEVGKGTGLGLSQVYGMALQSGGTARVADSATGATIEIWLRIAGAHDNDDAPAAFEPEAAKLPLPGAKVLVVEDDPSVRQSMAELLRVLGCEVSEAVDGAEGLAMLRREKPDLLITDYLMPRMTGAELMREANRIYPGLPMIIATGYADMGAIADAVGDNPVLRKPYQLADLAASVEQALRRGQAMPPATP